jgi:hypothetical protein
MPLPAPLGRVRIRGLGGGSSGSGVLGTAGEAPPAVHARVSLCTTKRLEAVRMVVKGLESHLVSDKGNGPLDVGFDLTLQAPEHAVRGLGLGRPRGGASSLVFVLGKAGVLAGILL